MNRSSISNKRCHDTMISPGDNDDKGDGCCCSHTERFKTKNSNEAWNEQEAAAVQLLLLSKTNKRYAKTEELGEEEISRRKNLLGASIHKDIGRVQEMMEDMNKTAGSQRTELMMSIRKIIHLVKQKLSNLEKMVPPAGRKLQADAHHAEFPEFQQQVLGLMSTVNIGEERPIIHQPFEKIRNDKKMEEGTMSSLGTTMTASNLTPLRKRETSRRRANDYFGENCPKATLPIARDLEIFQIKAGSGQSVPPRKVGLPTPKRRVLLLELSRAKPRRQATGAPDLFTHRERRFKAMREALSKASMEKSKTQFATIWMELDDTWRKMMAYETFKSFEKRKGNTVADYPMIAIDAHLDELESWISAL